MPRYIDMTPEQQKAERDRLNRSIVGGRIVHRIAWTFIWGIAIIVIAIWAFAAWRAKAADTTWSCPGIGTVTDGKITMIYPGSAGRCGPSGSAGCVAGCPYGKPYDLNFGAPDIGRTETFDADGHLVPEER